MTIATETMPAPGQPNNIVPHIDSIAGQIYREVVSEAIADKIDTALVEALERLLAPTIGGEEIKQRLDNFLGAIDKRLDAALSETAERLLAPVAMMEELRRKEYLTEQEVSILYSISTSALRSDRSRGAGPGYIKEGRKVLYPKQELKRYYERRLIKTQG